MFWIVVENLREQSEYKLEHNKSTYRALAMQMHKTVDEVKKYINDCINEYELFTTTDNFFYSVSLLRRMEKKNLIKESRRKAANARWNKEKDADAMQVHNKSNADEMQNYAKERKGKEKKEKEKKENKEFIPPTLLQVEEYVLEKGYVIDPKFFVDYFEARDWVNANGKPVSSWKGTIVTWNKKELQNNPNAKPYKKKEEGDFPERRDDY